MHSGKSRLKNLLLALLIFACHLSVVRAQTEPEKSKEAAIKIRILCSQPVKGFAKLMLAQGETTLTELSLLPSMVTDPIDVRRGGIALANRAAEKEKPVPVVNFSIPDAGRRFVLVIFPAEGKNDQTPYHHILIRTDGIQFKTSDIYLFNLTKLPIEGTFGSASFSLAPGKSNIVTPVTKKAGELMYQACFYYQTQQGKQMFNETRWPQATASRIFMFFMPDEARQTVSYINFREYQPYE